MDKALLRSLLRRHARTFSLTLSLLPRSLSEPLGVAYLLARTSDTVADSAGVETEHRLVSLRILAVSLESRTPTDWKPSAVSGMSEQGEELIRVLPQLLALLEELPDRERLLDLWETIVRGQIMDLTRFGPGTAPLSRVELEEYCRLVAGSVGAAWTGLIATHFPKTLLRPVDEMTILAEHYGKGLQLVNILRDRSEDATLGRSYLGGIGFEEAVRLARTWLGGGSAYVAGLAPGRILLASRLPLDLAVQTLERMDMDPNAARVRLSRSEVRRTLVKALPSLWLRRGGNPAS